MKKWERQIQAKDIPLRYNSHHMNFAFSACRLFFIYFLDEMNLNFKIIMVKAFVNTTFNSLKATYGYIQHTGTWWKKRNFSIYRSDRHSVELTPNGSAFSQEIWDPQFAVRNFSGRDSGTITNINRTSNTAIAVASHITKLSLYTFPR